MDSFSGEFLKRIQHAQYNPLARENKKLAAFSRERDILAADGTTDLSPLKKKMTRTETFNLHTRETYGT